LLQGLGRLYTRTRWVRPLYTALFKTAVQKTLQRIATDYDLIHAVYNGLTPSTVLVADVCQALDIPFVWTPLAHTTLPPGTGWSSRSFRRLYARADALIAMTAFEQDWLVAQGAAPERVHVCPVAPLLDGTANPQRFRASYDVGDAPMVLFLSRLVDTKGYKQLCDAARLVWAQSPRTLFVFVGPCAPEVQRWFAAQREPRLRVLGPLDEGDKVSALAACDVLCVPSSEESLGVTYLEAWSFAKPVVALALPVLRTVIAHGVDGLLTPPQSPALADALVYLLEHPDVRQAMGQCGAQKVAAHYDWDVLAQRLSGIYQAVLQTRRRVHTSRASGVLSETKP
jgi:glycosyltransferase involved in cell wall biosynthesis